MKQINLLPKPSWLERYQRLLAMAVLLILCAMLGVYFLYPRFELSSDLSACEVSDQYSINTIKMVGYLSQRAVPNADQTFSLLAFPNGEISAIEVGDSIGSEAAKVVDIQPTMTTLSLSNKTYVLTMQSVEHD